jgi:murein DD-endopeptidase MepM/ murein hydrolase activator NlpD
MSTIKERYAPQIDFNPYLTYPIKTDFQISEGFVYTKEERDISGNYFHKGIDFACPYGTPIYAAASGYTVASYFRFTNFNKRLRTPRLYKNKPLGNGMGYFIQIYHPEEICGIKGGRITQYGHLSKFADGIYTRKLKWDHRNWEERVRRN